MAKFVQNTLTQNLNKVLIFDGVYQLNCKDTKDFYRIVCHNWDLRQNAESYSHTLRLCIGIIPYSESEYLGAYKVPFGVSGITLQTYDEIPQNLEVEYVDFAICMESGWLIKSQPSELISYIHKVIQTKLPNVQTTKAFQVLYGHKP